MDWGWGVRWALWAQWGENCITIITLTPMPTLRTRSPTSILTPMAPTATRSSARRRTLAGVRPNHRSRTTNTYLRGPLPYRCTGKSFFLRAYIIAPACLRALSTMKSVSREESPSERERERDFYASRATRAIHVLSCVDRSRK